MRPRRPRPLRQEILPDFNRAFHARYIDLPRHYRTRFSGSYRMKPPSIDGIIRNLGIHAAPKIGYK